MITTSQNSFEDIEFPTQALDDQDTMVRILPLILDIGELLVRSGADVNHVERLVMGLGDSYGAEQMNVLVFTASIIVTMTLPDGREYTQTRRILKSAETDFYRLELLNKLCLDIKEQPLDPVELKRRFLMIESEKRLKSWHYCGGVLGIASYTAFFGGTALEVLASAIFATILCFLIDRFSPYTPNTIGFNVFATTIIGLLIGGTCKLLPVLSPDVLIIGEIMLIIPGLALTNSIRDMFSGDTLSGLLRFIDSLLLTGAMVIGFMTAMYICGSVVHTNISTVSYTTKLITVIPATLGFLLYYNSRKRLMVFGLVGALLSYGTFVAFMLLNIEGGDFWAAFACAMVASIYSELLSKKLHVPSAVFFVTCILSIIPGRFLFTAMNFLVQGDYELAGNVGFTCLQYSIAIAIAICVVWTVSRTWRNMQIKKRMTSLVNKEKLGFKR